MSKLHKHQAWRAAAFAALVGFSAASAHADYRDFLVQAPELKAPERGALAGAYGDLSVGPRDLARGSFTLPSPLLAPSERGPLLADVFPAYTPDAGQSEWGMGFRTGLTIRRYRSLGEVDYQTDDLATPWGIFHRGADGSFYPLGLRKKAVLTANNDTLVVRLDDGSRVTFLASDGVRAADGRGVYEWWLSSVDAPNGDRTQLSYTRNDSGRPYVSEVRYGGRTPEAFQYLLSFEYQTVPTPTHDYRSGKDVVLDRRVSKVWTNIYDPATQSMRPRYRHDLSYAESPAGAAFFLTSVQRVFASGEAEPALSYRYDFAETELTAAHLSLVPALDGYLTAVGGEGIQPTQVSFMDIDRDGRVDMEHAYGGTLVKRTDAGFEYKALPAITGSEDPLCRPTPSWNNTPRTLVRMDTSTVEPHVVVTTPTSAGGSQLTLCNRPGFNLFRQTFADDWTLGANTRLVDLDHDVRPDFIRIFPGGYQVMRNLSSSAGFSFQVEDPQSLSLDYQPLASWVQDMNGDTLPDLVARNSAGLDVWYGLSGRKFSEHVETFNLFTDNNQIIDDLNNYQLVFTDANKDGLTDVILAQGQFLSLYTNRGGYFLQFDVPGFSEVAWDVGLPVAVDLEGRGEEQAVMVSGQKAYAVTLSQPAAGLMVSALDGRGGSAGFGYERSRPTPGIRQRPPMLIAMDVHGIGMDDLNYNYDYEGPLFHSQAQHLLGFGLVQMSTPTGLVEASFHHDDDVQGLLTRTRIMDARIPGVYKVEDYTYQTDVFRNVVWWKDRSVQKSFSDDSGHTVLGSSVDYLEYSDLCAKRERRSNAYGSLTFSREYAQPAAFGGALHCLTARERVDASHPGRPALDVSYTASMTRDDSGAVTSVRNESSVDTIEAQHVEYDARHRPTSITAATGAKQLFSWNDQTGSLLGVTQPDGVVARASERDPVSDSLRELITIRDSASLAQSFRYDGLERLAQRWDDQGDSSADKPLERVSYAFAGDGRPASVLVQSLVDASASAYAETLELSTSGGQKIATASHQPEGWAFGAISLQHRADGRTDSFMRAPLLGASDGHSLTLATLTDPASSALQRQTWSSPLGERTVREDLTVAQGVLRKRDSTLSLGSDGVRIQTSENGSAFSDLTQDGEGRTVRSADASGAVTTREYDALGRLVSVHLPGGGLQTVKYDAHGRIARVDHPGISGVQYAYANLTGVLDSKTFYGADGVGYRRLEYTRDAIGRVTGERHVRLSDNSQRSYTIGYDGASPFGANLPGQRGFRTSVVTPGFKQEYRYRPDGKLTRSNLELAQFRLLQTEQTYAANGQVSGTLRKLFDGNGQLLTQVSQQSVFDAYGRLSEVRVNGTSLARIFYDADGRADHVELPAGQTVVFEHDAVTREQVGFVNDAPSFMAEFRTERNNRGQVGAERISWTQGTGPAQVKDRVYAYDSRGFLSSAGTQSYSYGLDGLPARATDVLGQRVFTRTGNTLAAGKSRYTFDAVGRISARDTLSLDYGPTGQLETARRGTDTFSYLYDENGNRVAKLKNGLPVAMYAGTAVVTSAGLFEPVRVAGLIVGVLQNGVFHAIAADSRGTLLGDAAFDASSPYGVRSTHASLTSVIDYAAKGYDADLGLVRMGVRDYDPLLGRFATPDPLFSVDTNKCAESPVECNLYGYAGNDPVSFVDPTGTDRAATDKIIQEKARDNLKNVKTPMDLLNALVQNGRDAETLDSMEDSRELATKVRHFLGSDSEGGAYLFGADYKSFVGLMDGPEKTFTISGHGSPGSFGVKGPQAKANWVDLSADQVVSLAKDEGFKPGTTIMLYSCNGGVAPSGGKSFAQQLADKTGSVVVAPGDYLLADGRVGHWVGGTKGGGATDQSGTFVPGGWVIAIPMPH